MSPVPCFRQLYSAFLPTSTSSAAPSPAPHGGLSHAHGPHFEAGLYLLSQGQWGSLSFLSFPCGPRPHLGPPVCSHLPPLHSFLPTLSKMCPFFPPDPQVSIDNTCFGKAAPANRGTTTARLLFEKETEKTGHDDQCGHSDSKGVFPVVNHLPLVIHGENIRTRLIEALTERVLKLLSRVKCNGKIND